MSDKKEEKQEMKKQVKRFLAVFLIAVLTLPGPTGVWAAEALTEEVSGEELLQDVQESGLSLEEEEGLTEETEEAKPAEEPEEEPLGEDAEGADTGTEKEQSLARTSRAADSQIKRFETSLEEGKAIKGSKYTFDVWAQDQEGNAMDTAVYLYPAGDLESQEPVEVNWEDTEKTSYTLDLKGKEGGAYEILIQVLSDGAVLDSMVRSIEYIPAEEGELIGYAAYDVEMFTISNGFLIEPELVPIYEGENAAIALVRLLEEHGYGYQMTGSLTSDFYLARITGMDLTQEPQLPAEVAEIKQVANSFNPDNYDYVKGGLGEFDFSSMSGWMYSLNNVFPNVGFADSYPQDGDVVRVQFTVGYGTEIGGEGGLGGSYGPDMAPGYSVGNKDELILQIARFNSAVNKDDLQAVNSIAQAYQEGMDVLYEIPASQIAIDEASIEFQNVMSGSLDELTGISLNADELTMGMNDVFPLTVSVSPSNIRIPVNAQFNSDNRETATVSANGTITATGAGTATITVSVNDGAYVEECQIYVEEVPAESLEILPHSLKLKLKEQADLEVNLTPANTTDAGKIQWSSSNEEVATVENGKVIAVGGGTAVITAKTGNLSDTCQVSVDVKNIESIQAVPRSLSLGFGQSADLQAEISPSDYSSRGILWSAATPEDEALLAVLPKGHITARETEGLATVRVTAVDEGLTSDMLVRITENPIGTTKAELPESLTMQPEAATELTAEITPANATDPLVWESSDPQIVSVTDGTLEGKKEGSAVITVYSGEKSASCKVTVKDGLTEEQIQTFENTVPSAAVSQITYCGATVTWKQVEHAQGYRIYRKTSGGSYVGLATAEGGDTLTYTDTSAIPGTTYYYTVKAYTTQDDTQYWSSYNKTGIKAVTEKLAAPKLLKTTPLSNTKLQVQWEETKGAKEYRIYRKTKGGSWTGITNVKAGTTTYTDTVKKGTTYYYTVRALYDSYMSDCDLTGISGATLATVGGLKASAKSNASVTVSWTKISGAEGYRIYRKQAGESWKGIGNAAASASSYTDTTALAGKTYYYTVRAYVGSYYSDFVTAGVKVSISMGTPALKKATVNTDGTVTITWSQTGGVEGYRVFRKTPGGSWKGLGNTDASESSYTDTTAAAGTTYYYTVRAFVGSTYSGYNTTGLKAAVTLQTPALVSAQAVSANSVTINWEQVGGADGYRVYRKTAGGSWKGLGNADASESSYTDSTAAAGTTYYYTVRAMQGSYLSGYNTKGISVQTPAK